LLSSSGHVYVRLLSTIIYGSISDLSALQGAMHLPRI